MKSVCPPVQVAVLLMQETEALKVKIFMQKPKDRESYQERRGINAKPLDLSATLTGIRCSGPCKPAPKASRYENV